MKRVSICDASPTRGEGGDTVTDSTTDPAYDSAPPNPQITFGDHVTDPDQREAVERDVAALVARYAEEGAKVRAAKAEQEQLVDALAAPFMKLIEEDPAARKARDDLRAGQLMELDQEQPHTATNEVITGPSRAALDEPIITPPPGFSHILALRQPPFDFTWEWHNPAGSPPFETFLKNENGTYYLEARSGFTPGGASTFVDARAGFGLLFRPAQVTTLMFAKGVSARVMGYKWDAQAGGIGGNATVEGWMELTALENGREVARNEAQLWRRRVSASFTSPFEKAKDARYDEPGDRPPELRFTMQPGREYTFNVGFRVFTDRSPGVGAAAARSAIEGWVETMNVFK
jgi:hypothetical protein